jgi:hypothetical protein
VVIVTVADALDTAQAIQISEFLPVFEPVRRAHVAPVSTTVKIVDVTGLLPKFSTRELPFVGVPVSTQEMVIPLEAVQVDVVVCCTSAGLAHKGDVTKAKITDRIRELQ